jgi:hypothetical protein
LGQRKFAAWQGVVALWLLILLLIAGGSACSNKKYILVDSTPLLLTAPQGYYEDIAWLEPNVLAMHYRPNLDTQNSKTRIIIYNTVSSSHYLLPDDIPQECYETWYGRVNRLPNGLLGYLWECIPHQGIARDFRLHQWDQNTHADQELYRYPIPFWATAFSFTPEMDYWLQEQSGDGLSNKLHFVASGESPVQLLKGSFARAGHPSWLPDGRIIFAGTPQLPESGTNLFSGLPGISARLAEPWNIYLTNLDSLLSGDGDVGEDQLILSDIHYIEAVKASPDGQFVSFLGTIEGNEGLWIYRLATGELTRIWAGFGPYDWSPDSKELVVLVREPGAEIFRGQPAKLQLP